MACHLTANRASPQVATSQSRPLSRPPPPGSGPAAPARIGTSRCCSPIVSKNRVDPKCAHRESTLPSPLGQHRIGTTSKVHPFRSSPRIFNPKSTSGINFAESLASRVGSRQSVICPPYYGTLWIHCLLGDTSDRPELQPGGLPSRPPLVNRHASRHIFGDCIRRRG